MIRGRWVASTVHYRTSGNNQKPASLCGQLNQDTKPTKQTERVTCNKCKKFLQTDDQRYLAAEGHK